MIDRYELIKYDEKTKEEIEIRNWIWNSHWWVEYAPGYCECKWCGMCHVPEIGVGKNYPLCEENPALKKFKKESIDLNRGKKNERDCRDD